MGAHRAGLSPPHNQHVFQTKTFVLPESVLLFLLILEKQVLWGRKQDSRK